jgi:hypothetical protein
MRLITHASIYVDILDMAVNRVNPKSLHAEQSSVLLHLMLKGVQQ